MTAPTLTPEQAGRIYRCLVPWLNTYCRYFDEWNMAQFAYLDEEMRDAMRPFGITLPDPHPEHPPNGQRAKWTRCRSGQDLAARHRRSSFRRPDPDPRQPGLVVHSAPSKGGPHSVELNSDGKHTSFPTAQRAASTSSLWFRKRAMPIAESVAKIKFCRRSTLCGDPDLHGNPPRARRRRCPCAGVFDPYRCPHRRGDRCQYRANA